MFEEKLYSIQEVAKFTRLTDRTIRNYLAKGNLKGIKIGGQWRFSEMDLCNLLANDQFENDMKRQVENKLVDFFVSNEVEDSNVCLVFKITILNQQRRDCFFKKLTYISKKYGKKDGLSFVDEQGLIKIFVISSCECIFDIMELLKREKA